MMLLRLKPSSTTCPVTKTSDGRYGTEALWTTLPRSGVLVRRDLFDKLPWIPDTSTEGEALSVSGRMLEAPFLSLRVLGVNWGYSSSGRGSWASAVSFRREGCWKITGRVSDVTLTYVLRVVRGG